MSISSKTSRSQQAAAVHRLQRFDCICDAQPVQIAAPGDICFTGSIGAAVTNPTNMNDQTGLLLLIHGMGSDWDEHDALALKWSDQYNVITLQVRDRQSGSAGLEVPYDLGKYQTIDCLRALQWVFSIYNVNRDRVYVWGGSGGGHIALLCLCYAPHLFTAGVALAPITHPTMPGEIQAPEWTDGWMRRCIPAGHVPPEEIAVRSPIVLCRNIQAELLILHGTDDDVVCIQHSQRLAAALEKEHIPFNFIHIEGGDHDFSGGGIGLGTRAEATETHADNLLKSQRTTTIELSHTPEIRLTDGYSVRFDQDHIPTLWRSESC